MVDYEISKEFSNVLYEKTKLEEKINVLNSVLKQLSLIEEKDLYKQTLNIKSKLVVRSSKFLPGIPIEEVKIA